MFDRSLYYKMIDVSYSNSGKRKCYFVRYFLRETNEQVAHTLIYEVATHKGHESSWKKKFTLTAIDEDIITSKLNLKLELEEREYYEKMEYEVFGVPGFRSIEREHRIKDLKKHLYPTVERYDVGQPI